MVESLKFRSRIAELCGGRDVLLREMTERFLTTHRITKAADASKISDESVTAHIETVFTATVRDLVKKPLTDLVVAHLQEVGDEFVLINGDLPEDETLAGLYDDELAVAIVSSLNGDVIDMAGYKEVHDLVHAQANVSDLVDLVLAVPIRDFSRAYEAFSLTDRDLEQLKAAARNIGALEALGALPDPIVKVPGPPEDFGFTELAALAHQRLEDGGDIFEVDQLLREILMADSKAVVYDLGGVMTDDDEVLEKLWLFVQDYAGELDIDVDRIMHKAAKPPKPPAPPKAPAPQTTDNRTSFQTQKRRSRRKSAAGGEPDAVSEAAQDLLDAILEHTGCSEMKLAEALGVSRGQMNNYRSGRTVWRPDETELSAIRGICETATAAIQDALAAMENALLADC